jgi:hypothetical protein
MENKINSKLDKYQLNFKNAIKEWMQENNGTVVCADQDKTNEFLQFVYDYSKMSINKEDLQKRTRVKNVVPHCDLCTAKIANGEQCTRRRQGEESSFCGTHIKGQPYGIETKVDTTKQQTKKVEIWVQEIKGINYYIDSSNNVYKAEDIISNIQNPAVIAKWSLNEEQKYTIPAFGI